MQITDGITTAILLIVPLYAQPPIRVQADATDAPRRLIHVKMTIPARPGPLTLLYPEWIPGEHAPVGPIADLVGLTFHAGGETIPWKRDDVNMFAFHLDVPAGASSIEAAFDFITAPDTSGTSSASSTTDELAVINWNHLLLYPQGAAADSVRYQASLRVPDSWRYGTALPIESESGDLVQFRPSSLGTLVDSPVSAGAFYRTIDLGQDRGAAHFLHIAADSAVALDITPDQITAYKNLVAETGALFGSRHYRDYHFLLTLSEHVAHFGLEHHESSDDRAPERTLIDEASRKAWADLLTHEFVHSWNGKFRRPAGLATGNYAKPMKGDLLWVYEGLTQYLGEILVPRTGLYSPEEFREALAATAAALDTESGRKWRPLEDTAVAAQILYGARGDYSDYRRSVDYYAESELIWLEADVLIRRLSHGARSLDDFCRAFFGGPGGAPDLKPYTLDELIRALEAVQPYNWAEFFNARIYREQPRAPLGGLENSGWKLVYNSTRSPIWNDFEEDTKTTNLMYSIGAAVKGDGTVSDVVLGGPCARAGIAPLTKIVAANGRQFSTQVMREAIAAASSNAGPLELLVKSGEFYKTHKLDYHGGERYPHLERDPSKPDLLSQIITPLARPRR